MLDLPFFTHILNIHLTHNDSTTVNHFIFILKYIIEDCLIHLSSKRIDNKYRVNIGRFIYIFLYIVNNYAFNEQIFFVHGSASLDIKTNKSLLYLAKSSGGKTTLSRLVQDTFPVIADDRILVACGEEFMVNKVSLINENQKSVLEYKIGGIFFIKKSKKTRIVPIHNKEIILDLLLKQTFFNTKKHKKILSILTSFIKQNKFYYLYFSKEKKEVEQCIIRELREKSG